MLTVEGLKFLHRELMTQGKASEAMRVEWKDTGEASGAEEEAVMEWAEVLLEVVREIKV